MNEQNNESQPTPNQTQPTQTNQNKPALAGVCLVCGGECAVGDTMCARCDGLMRGWLREYPSWLDSLHEFLDSTAHYGGRQPGRVNLPAAPTPIRLPVLDHMQEVGDMAVALWRRLYAPSAMPWANGRIERLRRMSTVEPASGHRHHLARLGILGAQDLVHHRCAAFQAGHRQMPEPIVRCRTVGAHRRGRGHMPRMRRHLPRGGRAARFPEGVHRIRQSVHGRGMRRTPARMRIPVQREHDSLMAQARQVPTGR